MKTIGILMAALMVFGVFASAGIALAETGGSQSTGVGGGRFAAVSANGAEVLLSNDEYAEGTVSSVQAVEDFSNEAGVIESNDLDSVIREFNGALTINQKKVGSLTGTYGDGYYVDSERNQLGLIQVIWVNALVTESNDALKATQVVKGKIKVDGITYQLEPKSIDDKSVEFGLTSSNGDSMGSLELNAVGSYNDGTRTVWNGKIVIDNEVEGIVNLVTVSRSVRQASQDEINGAGTGNSDNGNNPKVGTNMPYPDESESSGNRGAGEPVSVETQNGGFFSRILNFFGR